MTRWVYTSQCIYFFIDWRYQSFKRIKFELVWSLDIKDWGLSFMNTNNWNKGPWTMLFLFGDRNSFFLLMFKSFLHSNRIIISQLLLLLPFSGVVCFLVHLTPPFHSCFFLKQEPEPQRDEWAVVGRLCAIDNTLEP